MFLVYDKLGGFIEVDKYVDVKEMIASGHYISFVNKADIRKKEKKKVVKFNPLKSGKKENSFSRNSFKQIYCRSSVDLVKRKGLVTILSSAESVRYDIKKFGVHGDVIAINDIGFYYPTFHHHVSHHGDIIMFVKKYRNKFRSTFKNDYLTHTSVHTDVGFSEKEQDAAQCNWKFRPKAISSGILGIFIAIALGYEAIMVHGIPLMRINHFYDLEETHVMHQFDKFYEKIKKPYFIDLFRNNNVRFSSGRLTRFIERPTKEWINDYNRKITGD